MSERPERFFIKVCWHDFAFSTRLMNFSIVPAILSSFEITCIEKTLSVALEVSLSIHVYDHYSQTCLLV